MIASEIVANEIQQLIRKENCLNTVVHNIKEYVQHMNGVVVNFESLVDSLTDFFFDKSSYFKPNLVFMDSLREMSNLYKNHLDHFKGIGSRAQMAKLHFDKIKVRLFMTFMVGHQSGVLWAGQTGYTLCGQTGAAEESQGAR